MQRIKNLSDLTDKTIARNNLDVYAKHEVDDKVNAKLDKSEKGQPNGLATLNKNGAIDSRHIPSYLENPLVYTDRSKFPTTGRLGKLYMDEETGKLYVWKQNQYKE